MARKTLAMREAEAAEAARLAAERAEREAAFDAERRTHEHKWREVRRLLDARKNHLKTACNTFTNSFATNPLYALKWNAEPVMAAAAILENGQLGSFILWMESPERLWDDRDLRTLAEATRRTIESLVDEIQSATPWDQRTTSHIERVIAIYKANAYRESLFTLRAILRVLEYE